MARKKRSIVKGTIPGYYSRPQAHVMIAEALGLSEPEPTAPRTPEVERWHKVYRDLRRVFHDKNTRHEILGSGGTTGRIIQVHKDALYEFADKEFGVKIPEWKSDEIVVDERIDDILKVIGLRDKQIITDADALGAIRRIVTTSITSATSTVEPMKGRSLN